MNTIKSIFNPITLIILALITSSCGVPGLALASFPLSSHPTSTPVPPLVTVAPNATPTATPFQPIPPTAVYNPSEFPAVTSQPSISNSSQPIPTISAPSNLIHILLLGSDQRPWSSNFRTDTIILATLNPDLGIVSLTSFPRDLYIYIPNWTTQRINTAFAHGGFPLLARTFEHNFGIRPDHYVLVNFSSFKQFVDSLGGLDVNVGKALSDYRGSGYGYVTIPVGTNHMNADTVLWYVRSRKTSNDFARGRRQQEVLKAIAVKLFSLNAIKRVPEFYQLYNKNVTTDLTLADILSLLPFAARINDTSRIRTYFIGPKQVYDWITPGGGMVLLPRQGAIDKVLRRALKGN